MKKSHIAIFLVSGMCGLVVLVVLGLAALAALRLLFSQQNDVAAAIIATAGTVLLGITTVVYNQRRAKAREIQEAHRPIKVELYKDFMGTAVVDVLQNAGDDSGENSLEGESRDKLQKFFYSFTADLIIWGSREVIRAYRQYRTFPKSDENVLLLVDDMLRAMRTDLGNSNFGFKRGDLVSLFLRDPDELHNLIAQQQLQ